jgi:predicted lipoprotein with Yx(FWY)xxD motif
MATMHRSGARSVGILAIAGAMLLSACADKTDASSGSGGSGGSSGGTDSVTISTTSISGLGDVLVDGDGMTLYYLKTETPGKIMCSGSCADAWPPLLLPSGETAATAGSGVDASKLGTIERPDGGTQVTYDGQALYLFAGDQSGQATGQGVGGFFAVTTSGSGASGATGATGSSGGGGYYKSS